MNDIVFNGLPDVLNFVWTQFKRFIDIIDHLVLWQSGAFKITLLRFIIAVVVIDLIIGAIFVIFEVKGAEWLEEGPG